MKAADYTLPFYRKCLSQHIWDWRSRFAMTAIITHHRHNEEMLKQVAHERGGEFLDAFNKHTDQPVFSLAGIPAAETNTTQTPNTNTPMKLEINIPDDLFNPLVQAIDRLTEAVKTGGALTPPFTVTTPLSEGVTGTTPVTVETTPEPDKPKAGRPKKNLAATPEPTTAPVVAETSQAETIEEATTTTKVKVPTGPELSEKVKPLAAHPDLQADLIRFKANELKVNGPIRLVTDENILTQFAAKVDELLAQIPTEV